jgi:ADP-ribose pyrophosphatase YjhB (NUDIX family)
VPDHARDDLADHQGGDERERDRQRAAVGCQPVIVIVVRPGEASVSPRRSLSSRVVKLVADVTLLGGQHVLLVKYADVRKYDGERGWFLPDDYLEHAEHPATAAVRILRDQVGLDPAPDLTLFDIESFANGAWHLIFHYCGEVSAPVDARPGANVAAAEWFALDALPRAGELAHHGWALETLAKIPRAASAIRPA